MMGAAIGSAVIGGIGAVADGKAADRAHGRASDIANQRMDFNQAQLDKWEQMFGGIEENLSNYYSNLDPTKFATQSKSDFSASMDKQMSQFNDTMASKGLMTAGQTAQTAKEAAFAKAAGNAQIDMKAPEQVAQMQQGWLQQGANQRANAISGINNAYAGQQGIQTNQANRLDQSSAGWADMAGSAIGAGIGGGAFDGLGSMFGSSGGMNPGTVGGGSTDAFKNYWRG